MTLLILAVCGLIAAAIAVSKGRNPVGWFFGGLFLGLVGVVIVSVLSNLKEEEARRQHAAKDRRRLREQTVREPAGASALAKTLVAHAQRRDVYSGGGPIPEHQLNAMSNEEAEARRPELEARSDREPPNRPG